MGFLDIFKKKDLEKPLPTVDNPFSQDKIEAKNVNNSFDNDSTKIESADSTFEIPDFTDDDLNLEPPEKISESNDKEIDSGSDFLDEIPAFETSRMVDLDSIKDVVRPPKKPVKNSIAEKPDDVHEMFIEEKDYLEVLSREEEVMTEAKYLGQSMNKIIKELDKSTDVQKQILVLARKIKDSLLALDTKIFDEGD